MGFEINRDDLPPVYNTTPICDIDYPRRPVPGIHISGCNLRCPYCINHEMIRHRDMGEFDAKKVVERLVDSGERYVMISGAEPLFNKKTINLIALLNDVGLKVCVATNGTNPRELQFILESGMIFHAVMDIKTSLDEHRYAEVCGMTAFNRHMGNILESISLMKRHLFAPEFRTTMCSLYVNRDDVRSIAEFIGKKCIYTLQYYTTHQTLRGNVADSKYVIPYEELMEIADEISPFVRKALVSEV